MRVRVLGLKRETWGTRSVLQVNKLAVNLGKLDAGFGISQFHFADVDVVAGSWKQRLEDESLGEAGFKLAVAIDADTAFAGFGASNGRIEKVLRVGDRWSGVRFALGEALGCV